MLPDSILFALDGSRYSRDAAELCWEIADRAGSEVFAYHVIDMNSCAALLQTPTDGFLRSKVYEDASSQVRALVWNMGNQLAQAYSETAEHRGVPPHVVTEDGDPYSRICHKALEHDLVIMGHRPFSEECEERRSSEHKHRLSLAESLTHGCPCPLLIVQSLPVDWLYLTILVEGNHINERQIDQCLELADAMQLQPVVLCLTAGAHQEAPLDLISNLRLSDARLTDIPIAVADIENFSFGIECVTSDDVAPADGIDWHHSLVVLPTRELGGSRITVLGSSPSMFLRFSALPGILFWPEDAPHLIANPMDQETSKTCTPR